MIAFQESEILFDRLAVQAGKRRLLEAINLARSSPEYGLLWLLVQQKLFVRQQQIYRHQEDWLRDALDFTMELASDNNLTAYQRPFADSLAQIVGTATQGPFLLIASTLKRLASHWQEHAFLSAAYAIWNASAKIQMLSTSRNALESVLSAKATFLVPSDFE